MRNSVIGVMAALAIAPVPVAVSSAAENTNQSVIAMPLPSIRGMYCNSPCSGTPAPDRHLGELAVLVIFRKQCFQGEEPTMTGVTRLLDYRFHPVWEEWNAAPMEVKREALKHEFAALDARRQKYGEQIGGWPWFCNTISERINKGDYRDLETTGSR
jgi:hypothetical protein